MTLSVARFKQKAIDYSLKAKMDYWELPEAVAFLCHYKLRDMTWDSQDEYNADWDRMYSDLRELAIRSVSNGKLRLKHVAYEDFSFPEGNERVILHDDSTVEPEVFIKWAMSKSLQLPSGFITQEQAIENEKSTDKTKPTVKYEGFKVPSLRNNQRRRERCRAIAALLWEKEPELTIASMIFRDEITVFGCENQTYSEDTIRDWIHDLAPDPKPGRPKKRAVT